MSSSHEQLLERSKRYEQDLSEQLKEYSGKAEKIGKNALVIAGGVFIAYQVVKLITGGKKKSKSKFYSEISEGEHDNEHDDSPRVIIKKEKSGVGMIDLLKAEVGGILVAIARDRILEFIHQLENKKSDEGEKEA